MYRNIYIINMSSEYQYPICATSSGIIAISGYSPTPNLTMDPLPVSQSHTLCCNEQRKALRRVRPASTIINKDYYTTHQQYRQNRCQTYKQRAFNFYSGGGNPNALAGTPTTLSNTYVANCYPTKCQSNCSKVIYKPSNPQFAKEGGVSSSTRTLKLGLTTVEKNVFFNNLLKGSGNRYENRGGKPFVPFIHKSKSVPCAPLISRTFYKKPTGGTGVHKSC